ncbi:MAG: STAS domain-containing protein [Paracoccaceae bacterium]
MTETVKLRPRLDLVSAPDLLADLMSADKTGPLEVDAGEVIHLGALGLQILIASGLETKAAGGQMRLRHVGDDLEEQLHVSGLTIQNIEEGAT